MKLEPLGEKGYTYPMSRGPGGPHREHHHRGDARQSERDLYGSRFGGARLSRCAGDTGDPAAPLGALRRAALHREALSQRHLSRRQKGSAASRLEISVKGRSAGRAAGILQPVRSGVLRSRPAARRSFVLQLPRPPRATARHSGRASQESYWRLGLAPLVAGSRGTRLRRDGRNTEAEAILDQLGREFDELEARVAGWRRRSA